MMIRAVSFDVGETLLRPYPSFTELFGTCCREAGFALAEGAELGLGAYANRYFGAIRDRGETFSATEQESRRTWLRLYQQFLLDQGASAAEADRLAQRAFETFTDPANYRLFDDALPTLRALRARGFRIGVISNWERWLDRLLQVSAVQELLDFVAISGVVGHEKPDRRIFDHAVAAARLPAAEILHIGDSVASDVVGAEAAGLRAILLDRDNRHSELPHRRITALDELLTLPELAEPALKS